MDEVIRALREMADTARDDCGEAGIIVPVTGTWLVVDGVVTPGSIESVCGGTVRYWHPEGDDE